MEFLARLQPIDEFLGLIWLLIVGWGLLTGVIRQVGMLVAVVGGTLIASTLYHQTARMLTQGLGSGQQALLPLQTYTLLFAAGTAVLGFAVWHAVPLSRLQSGFGIDNLIGALLGALWAVVLLIVVLTLARYFTAVPWQDQELRQQVLLRQIENSRVLVALQSAGVRPVWQLLTPWLPAEVHTSI
jgi:uncharacterized membrane protein required for colicin V production